MSYEKPITLSDIEYLKAKTKIKAPQQKDKLSDKLQKEGRRIRTGEGMIKGYEYYERVIE